MFKRLISLFLVISVPFILSANTISLSTDSHPMSGNSIEEEFDDDDLLIVLIAGALIVTGAIVIGPSIFEDGGLLGPVKYWEAQINLLFGITL